MIGSNWQLQMQNRISRLHKLRNMGSDSSLLLPAPNNSISHPSAPMSPVLNPAHSLAVSPIRSAESASSRSTVSLNLEQLKSFMLFFSDLKLLENASIGTIVEKVTMLFRYVEGISPLSFVLPRFRLFQQFDGLLVVVSALSLLNTLGSGYEDVQNRLMSFLFVVEMSSELNPRPPRPIGVLSALRYQLEHSTKNSNRKLALSLLGKYSQHEDSMHSVLAELGLVAPVASWLFHEATPAVACSISILRTIEDSLGSAQLRAVPGISKRVFDLLSWTSTLTVVTSALVILPMLDHMELLELGIVPQLLTVLRQSLAMGVDSLALMAVVCLQHFVQNGASSVASDSSISHTDIISELLNTVRGLERSSRSRHLIKTILDVLATAFDDPECSLSYCRQFRSLNGHSILQDLLYSMDHTRRFSLQNASEQMEFILQPDNWDDLHEIIHRKLNRDFNSTQNSHWSSMEVDGEADTAEHEFEKRLPKSSTGALVTSSGVKPGAKSHDQLDVVTAVYQTLTKANKDLCSEAFETVDSASESLFSDFFWVSTSLIHNLHEPALILRSLDYLSTLCSSFVYFPSSHRASLSSSTKGHLTSIKKHVRILSAVVRRVVAHLEPSWVEPHSLSQRVPRGRVSHSPPGSDVAISCISMAAVMIQHYLESNVEAAASLNTSNRMKESSSSVDNTLNSDARMDIGEGYEAQVDPRLAFAAVLLDYCHRRISTPTPLDLDLDPEIFKPLVALCSHALLLHQCASDSEQFQTLIYHPILRIVQILSSKSHSNWSDGLNLEWQILKALVVAARKFIPEILTHGQASSTGQSLQSSLRDLDDSIKFNVPELVIPPHPLQYWSASLEPLACLISSNDADTALLGIVGLSSFVTTPRGRQLFESFASTHKQLIEQARALSIALDMFWTRSLSVMAIYPDQ